ncbi:MAG: laminin G domain-containing protein [Kiritimatiellae bacterium]|nr:laminin G domain-containing protein [Kiritimatiellia bacterium]
MRMRSMVFLAGVLCAAAADAKTLIWYHFNEGAVGETTTSPGEKTIVNAAETGSVYDGRVWTCPATGSTSNRSMAATSEYVGTYAEGFPTSVRVIDPQTGAAFTNERCLYLGAARNDGYGKSAIITVDDAAELHVSNLTVEAFVKFDETDTSGTWRTIAMKQTDAINGRCSWGLRAGGGGGLMSQTDGRNATNGFDTTQANVSSPSLFDGKWHHVAMVVDGEAMTQSIYQDYRLVKRETLLHPIDYTGDDPIVIGNTIYANYGCLGGGWIDEFRLSDTALSPKDFLHFRTRPDELVDDDTVVYLTFDAMPWFGGNYLHNEAWGASATNAVLYVPGKASFDADAVPGVGTVRDGIFSSNLTVNAGSLHVVTNKTAMKSACVLVDDLDHSLGSGTFTIEGFFRWSPANLGRSNTHYFFTSHHASLGRAIDLLFDSQGRLHAAVIAKCTSNLVDEVTGEVTNTAVFASSKELAKNYGAFYDDAWHHVALVYDKESQVARAYADYKLLGSATGVPELYVLPIHASYENNFMIGTGYGSNSAYQMDEGYMDEIRITKRALAAQEFLMRDAAPDFSTSTLAWWTFEEDYMPEPRAESRKPSSNGTYSFANEVPGGPHTIITDGYGNELRRGNTRSLKLTKGKTAFVWTRDLPLENHDAITVEFFAKSTDAQQYSTVLTYQGVRKGYEGGAYDGTISSPKTIWAVQGANGNKRYRTHVVTTANTNYGMTGNSEDEAAVDGKWHHIAATFENDSASKVRTTLYCDYKLASTGTTSGQIRTNLVQSLLYMGGAIEGYIDEIRISKGVLPVEAFLRRQTQGLVLVIR